jgi:DNA-binding transcriptional regulator YdaS (Cro superfamily)
MAMDTSKSSPLQAAESAINLLGGPVAAARRLGIERYQTVQSWLRNRVPAEHCPAIERETGVRCEDLRPDVPWGVLRGQPWDGVERRNTSRSN